jgi:glutamate-ammonia-ligase adenylyltransferase
MALGKLGGGELNYSSDIDLLGLYLDEEGPAPASRMGACKEIYTRVMESVRSDLSTHTEEGYAYRVDLRLRPFGASGDLVPSVRGLLNYYSQKASLWEIQAALKMRPVAGNLALGYGFLEQLRPVLVKRRKKDSVARSIETMRSTAMKAVSREMSGGTDVKSGFGGIRDVEFLVQGLQIIHAPDSPMLLEGNTLAALDALSQWGIVPGPAAEQLKEDYIFLRRIEHFLQILEDQQIHALPADRAELDALSKKMMGVGADGALFLEGLKARLQRVHEMYETYLLGRGAGVY